MKERLFLLALMLLVSLSAYTQNGHTNKALYTIKGQVTDSLSKESVPYATLRIAFVNSPRKPVKLMACDEKGQFVASINQPGNYVIRLESLGKLPAYKYFKLSEDQKSLDLGQLFMNDDTQKLNEVTVTAQKPLVKVEIDKLVYSLEDDPEAKTSNALDMFRKVPMITVDGEDKIQLKGSSNYKIYMNGKPSNLLSGSNAPDVLKSMPASSIRNIEVITDPGARYDAEGVGGIINIITAKNALQGYTGTVRANASTFGSFGAGGYVSLKAGKLGLTANYGYNQRNTPWYDSYATRITDNDKLTGNSPSLLTEKGRSKNKGPFQYGYLEVSYEIDSLNLLSVGGNLYRGSSDIRSELEAELNPAEGIHPVHDPVYQYRRNSKSQNTFGSTDLNVDFQHSTRKKDELLTLSYRFSNSPNDNENRTELSDAINYNLAAAYPQWNINDASTTEHTAQVDYTTPIKKKQTIEGGVKYINRRSKSETLEQIYRDSLNAWEDVSAGNSKFSHTQQIYAAYLGYLIKIKMFGVKLGIRAEGTHLNATFAKAPEMNFRTDYFDVVPNATLTYQLDMASQIRLGYNMRIQRPGIWYLSPYIDDTNPQAVSQGNPKLDSEKSNNVNLNFSKFARKFSINVSMNYTFVNNSIERYSRIADFLSADFRSQYNGVIWNTYGNIGRKNQAGLFLYGNWSPLPLFNLYVNGSIDYTDLQSKAMNIQNDGFSGRIFAGAQFNLPKDFRINLQGGYFSSRIMLQGKQSPFYFTGFNFSKDFLKKKLSVSVSAQNPFWKTMKMEMTTAGQGFEYVSTNWRNVREFRFSISYRFGTLKDKIKKVRRSIRNDDLKGGNSSNNSGGQENRQSM